MAAKAFTSKMSRPSRARTILQRRTMILSAAFESCHLDPIWMHWSRISSMDRTTSITLYIPRPSQRTMQDGGMTEFVAHPLIVQ
ncbi:hypothetical protein BJX99DRAFT_221884 [Aspergillus californicus]